MTEKKQPRAFVIAKTADAFIAWCRMQGINRHSVTPVLADLGDDGYKLRDYREGDRLEYVDGWLDGKHSDRVSDELKRLQNAGIDIFKN